MRRRRVPLLLAGAGALAALGLAGLLRGAVPEHAAASTAQTSMSSGMNMPMASGMAMPTGTGGGVSTTAPAGASAGMGGPMEVTKAYVQEPASPTVAAAYFTVTNRSGQEDALVAVSSSVAGSTELHVGAGMSPAPAGGIPIAAGKALALRVGNGHVMMEQLSGAMVPGQTVRLTLQFQHAAAVVVAAPVIAIGAAVPQ